MTNLEAVTIWQQSESHLSIDKQMFAILCESIHTYPRKHDKVLVKLLLTKSKSKWAQNHFFAMLYWRKDDSDLYSDGNILVNIANITMAINV